MGRKDGRPWWRKKRCWALITVLTLLLFVFIEVNVIAYRHTRAMLNFVPPSEFVMHPELLSNSEKVHIVFHGVPLPKPVNRRNPEDIGLGFSTHTVPVDSTVLLEAWYIPHSQARAVVLLFHGRMCAKDMMLEEARVLHGAGIASFLVDFRGSGGSNQSYDSFGYYEADDVAASARFVREKLTGPLPMFLYGQSMGAVAVIRAAAVHNPQVQGIVLHSVFDTLENAARQQFQREGIPTFPAVPVMLFWGSRQLGIAAWEHNPIDYAKDVTCPVLLLHGTQDLEATISGARGVRDAVPGEAKLLAFPGLGHAGSVHEMPELWEDAVIGFIDA